MKIYRYGPSNSDIKIETDEKTSEELKQNIGGSQSSSIDVDLTINKTGQKRTRAKIEFDDEDIESMFLAYYNRLKKSLGAAHLKIAILENIIQGIGQECDENYDKIYKGLGVDIIFGEDSLTTEQEIMENVMYSMETIREIAYNWEDIFINRTNGKNHFENSDLVLHIKELIEI